jgi:hypothetical protein
MASLVIDIAIFNPRRPDWDASWVQSIENPQFVEQVNWELDHLEQSSIICYCFDPNGKAPITLLELGLFARDLSKEIVVCCPKGFWRKGNVDIVCLREGIQVVDTIPELIYKIRELVE